MAKKVYLTSATRPANSMMASSFSTIGARLHAVCPITNMAGDVVATSTASTILFDEPEGAGSGMANNASASS